MNILRKISHILKERLIDLLITIDSKLGGDSSTQSHASNWGANDD